jgi:hypothetical protein
MVDSEYDFDEAESFYPRHKCFYLHMEHPPADEPEVTPLDLTPTQ